MGKARRANKDGKRKSAGAGKRATVAKQSLKGNNALEAPATVGLDKNIRMWVDEPRAGSAGVGNRSGSSGGNKAAKRMARRQGFMKKLEVPFTPPQNPPPTFSPTHIHHTQEFMRKL